MQFTLKRLFSSTFYNLRTIPKNPAPLPFPVPSRTGFGVQFNLSKIKRLSGTEKIELLRDYLNHKQTAQALFVYKIIENNGFLNMLGYGDHHKIFRLLLQNPLKYKSELKLVHSQIRDLATNNFMNDYCIASTKWNSVEESMEIYKLLVSSGQPNISTFNNLLALSINQNNAEISLKLWQDLQSTSPIVRGNRKTYLLGMDVMKLQKNVSGVYEIFNEAEDNLSRLGLEHMQRINQKNQLQEADYAEAIKKYKKSTMSLLYSKLLAILIENTEIHNLLKTIHAMYQEYNTLGYFKNEIKIYHLLFKMLARLDQQSHINLIIQYENKEININIDELAQLYWNDLEFNKIAPDALLYSRLLSLLNTELELVKVWQKAPKTRGVDTAFVKRMEKLGADLSIFEDELNARSESNEYAL